MLLNQIWLRKVFGLVRALLLFVVIFGEVATVSAVAADGKWRPTDSIEIVVGAAPGGGNDYIARTMQKIIHDEHLVKEPLNVVNKPGGGGSIAYTYLNRHAGDALYLGTASDTLLTNQIVGRTVISYSDLTPIAIMANEYIAFVVKANSSLKTGKDLVARLKANPTSVTFGISSSLGNVNHIAAATVAQAVGVDPKKLRLVVFPGSGRSMASVLGGHIDVMVGPPSVVEKNVEAGTLRALATTSPKRLAGSFASVPTWRELGVDVVVVNWRGVVGPKGLSHAQVAYWEQVFRKVAQSAEWKSVAQKNLWENAFLGGNEAGAYMKAQYDQLKGALVELELAK